MKKVGKHRVAFEHKEKSSKLVLFYQQQLNRRLLVRKDCYADRRVDLDADIEMYQEKIRHQNEIIEQYYKTYGESE